MGFSTADSYIKGWIDKFGRELLEALANCRKRVEDGSANAAISRWFGTALDAGGRQKFGQRLGIIRSNLNLRSISVGFVGLQSRVGSQNARAWNIGSPQLSLGKNLVLPGSGGINTIELDLGFKNLPDYLPVSGGSVDASGWNQSKFETLVHELTHVLVGTKDEALASGATAYGAQNALALAGENPTKAFNNAENWAIFIESCGINSGS